MWDTQWKRSCATCVHKTRIGARIPAACAGCIKDGTLTRWEALRLEEGKKDNHKSTA